MFFVIMLLLASFYFANIFNSDIYIHMLDISCICLFFCEVFYASFNMFFNLYHGVSWVSYQCY